MAARKLLLWSKHTLIILASAAVILAGIMFATRGKRVKMQADKILVEKKARRLSLWRNGVLLKSYRVALGPQPVGHKQQEGDGRTPEGSYRVDWRNPNSKFYLSLHISYPDDADQARAAAVGVAPGGDIMIHGLPNGRAELFGQFHYLNDWTLGCIAVNNEEIKEIWDAVPDGVSVEITP